MSTHTRSGRTELWISRGCQDAETIAERAKFWEEPNLETAVAPKAAVVYYLSQNGQLEHPHFIEVPLSSPRGLYLRDVIHRLNSLRGQGMANIYSWSSKRSYKKGYVWQDLSEDDFIHPSHGHEYILKGSQLLETSLTFRSYETVSSSSTSKINSNPDTNSSIEDKNDKAVLRKKNRSWATFSDLKEYKVYKAKTTAEVSRKSTDVSTQTEEKTRRGKASNNHEEEEEEVHGSVVDLGREEVSPPASNASSETVGGSADIRDQMGVNDRPSGRIKASKVLMQLVACGSRKVKDDESVIRE